MKRPLLLIALASLCLAACRTTVTDEDGNLVDDTTRLATRAEEAAAQGPWTARFYDPVLLVADDVFIEGPKGLLAHLAIRQDEGRVLFVQRTIPEGLLQQALVAEGLEGVEIRAQLDGVEIVALKRLRALERPGDVPVRLEANGEVLWRPLQGEEPERRAARIEIVGDDG